MLNRSPDEEGVHLMQQKEVHNPAIAITRTPAELLNRLILQLEAVDKAYEETERAYRLSGIEWLDHKREDFTDSLQVLVDEAQFDAVLHVKKVSDNDLERKALIRQINNVAMGYEYA